MALTKVRAGGYASGGIIQVQHTLVSSTSQWTVTADTDKLITSLAVDITPISTSSIIKIEAMVNGEWSTTNTPYNSTWFFFRDSTKLSAPSAGSRNVGILMGSADTYTAADAGSTPELIGYSYFDTPNTTSQVTYTVGVRNHVTGYWYLNRTVDDTDNNQAERGVSMICVTEIAG